MIDDTPSFIVHMPFFLALQLIYMFSMKYSEPLVQQKHTKEQCFNVVHNKVRATHCKWQCHKIVAFQMRV